MTHPIDNLPPLPEPVEIVRAKMRGEWEWLTSGDQYFTADQARAYGQACARAALSAGQGGEDQA